MRQRRENLPWIFHDNRIFVRRDQHHSKAECFVVA